MAEEVSELVQRARDGDVVAREELLCRYLPELRAFVRLRCGPKLRVEESCSDLVQSVCREALVHLEDLRGNDEASFRSWLYRVAQHKILHKVEYYGAAKRDREKQVPSGGEEAGDAHLLATYSQFCTPSRQASMREEVARIEEAFDQLPVEQRHVLTEVSLRGRSHAELAEELGKNEVAVRKILSRARARLAILLGS